MSWTYREITPPTSLSLDSPTWRIFDENDTPICETVFEGVAKSIIRDHDPHGAIDIDDWAPPVTVPNDRYEALEASHAKLLEVCEAVKNDVYGGYEGDISNATERLLHAAVVDAKKVTP